ncbi:bifunctional DNA primase/polymerase [Streptomyces sp. G44]|uniref:bifunctional DNA primase/polymerase n=1 Tax=Streptomyces sp. G44 TaxID=2807632 RepID=UPI0019604456|nr:bifunctional DNA primase/polymerase [Streptomyces sp. G44]MBM7167871.1 bifunctional DNA primase/polymerase [Streptomyces sp. G44]
MSAPTRSRTPAAPSPAATARRPRAACHVTAEGAAWLASADSHPRSALAHWRGRPTAPAVLPCGSAFDVVSVPAVFGRRMLDRLEEEGPGSGPVAAHRGRMLLFAAPGTASRLPSLLEWEEWGRAVPSVLCHGTGDAVTVPPLTTAAGAPAPEDTQDTRLDSRWLVAPATRHPWLPGPEVMLWACVRVARSMASSTVRVSIFPGADQDAKVYDVSRRR